MRLDFEQIQKVRDNLTSALLQWQTQYDDGMWRSKPGSAPSKPPSYSCTPVAIQALFEAGKVREAQLAARRMQWRMLGDGVYRPLPWEATGEGYHIINNSWAVFVVQEVLGVSGEELWPAIDWLLNGQVQGEWTLVPGDDTETFGSPMFTAYALVALSEYLMRVRSRAMLPDENTTSDQAQRVTAAVRDALDALDRRRIRIPDGSEDLRLWSVRYPRKGQSAVPSLGISVLCLHAIAKAGRALSNEYYMSYSKTGFEEIARKLEIRDGRVKLAVGRQDVHIWDWVHDGNRNYFYSIYVPLCLVTALGFLDPSKRREATALYDMINYFTTFVLDRMPPCTSGVEGVYSGPDTSEVSVWATAGATIALSRVLQAQDALRSVETAMTTTTTGTAPSGVIPRFTGKKRVAVFCPLSEEMEIVVRRLDLKKVQGQQLYVGCIGDCQVVGYSGLSMGRVPAAVATCKMIQTYEPDHIIVTGIAGAFRSKGIRLGDVLVPTQIFDVARRKVYEEESPTGSRKVHHSFRPVVYHVNSYAVKFILQSGDFDSDGWQGTAARLSGYRHGRVPQLQAECDILCSDEVVATEEWRAQFKPFDSAIGVEMEAGGVCAALERDRVAKGVSVLRGVSDFANVAKSDDKWRRIAVTNVAELLHCYLLWVGKEIEE